ncbi:transferase family-domain-containing protein [Earliella scabrosa]|nr:transferase family-domain-containing protein [Earliella scabrosa]
MAHIAPDVHVESISRTRLLPKQRSEGSAHTVPLSILDNSVVRFALTSAVWYFDSPPEAGAKAAFDSDALTESLQITLNSYPQWAGQLHWLPYDPANGQRHGRVALTYGSSSDPGIELIHARCSNTLASLVPDSRQRIASGAWNADSFPSQQLLAPTSLALHNRNEYMGLPCVSVQLTAFACGGFSVGLRLVHCIADAIAMFQFVKDWAAVHRALLQSSGQPSLPVPNPIFDPALLDKAAGDMKADGPDPALLSVAQALPMHRYDWWSSANGCPAPMLPATQVPEVLRGTDIGPPGEPMPWSEWDVLAPVAHYLVYFAPAEVQRMWEDASRHQDPSAPRISRLDALLAFVWRLIVRARGMAHDPELINMAVTIGVRSRLSPPLPDAFLGSPITLARVSLTGEEIVSAESVAPAASAIRAAMSQFTPPSISALLHEMMHAVNPQRTWRAFLGRRHSIVTSWQNLDAYGVDFGGGAPPRYVDAVMPSMDGCIHVMEAGPLGAGNGGRWYAEPVCVSLHLAADVMDKLLKDPELRKYRDA